MADASNSIEHEEKIKEFVKSGNKKRLHALLGCELKKSRSNNIKEVGSTCSGEISSSTPKAIALLDLLHYRLLSKTQRQQQHRIDNEEKFCMTVDEILQALLLIDPSYITPWKALDEFASAFQNNPVIPVLHCFSTIEEFLLKAKFPFGRSRNQSGNKKDIPQCVKDLMVQFVQKLTNYLLLADVNDKNNVGNNSKQVIRTRYEAGEPIFYKIISELLCTVLIVCRDWCSVLFNNIVSIVHLRRPHPSKIKIWLQLIQPSLLLLANKHIERIAEILRDQLCEIPNEMPPRQDIPLIVSIVVEMANSLTYSTSIVYEDPTLYVKKLWRNIILVLFRQISINRSHQCYSASESNLKKGMNKWSAITLKRWIVEIIDYSHSIVIPNEDDVIPFWFSWNLLSICFEVLNAEERQSTTIGLVGVIMADHSPQRSETSVNVLTEHEYQSILQFALGTTSDTNSLLDERIEEMCYNSNDGSLYFQDGDGGKIDCLSACGNAIMRSLLLVECNTTHDREDENRSSAIPRALRLINMVDDIVANCPDEQLLQASAFAAVAKTVAYFEVPKFRHLLENKIKQDISKPSRLQTCQYSTLRLIVTSAINMGNNDEFIERWMDIFEGDLSSSDVAHLCQMFAHLRIARTKILSCSKKLLAPMYCYWIADEIENEDVTKPEVQQRIIDGIVCLLELVRINHWNKNEIAAWTILSDTLVLDVPHLPIESRRWLYQKLTECVTADTFSVNTLEHLFRSTTVRMSFLVERDPSTSILITRAQHIQEIVSLHRLITVVLRSLANVDKHSGSRHIILAQGREAFLRSILSYKKGVKSRDHFLKGILKQMYSMKDKESCSFTLCWLLFLELNFYLLDLTMMENSKSKTCEHLVDSSTGKGNTIVSKLVEEIKGIEGRELKIDIDDNSIYKNLIPSWLQNKTGVFRSENPHSIKPTDTFNPKLSCFDLTLEFLFLVPLPVGEAQDFDDPLAWKIIAATGFLISRKQMLSAITECTLSNETIKQTAEPFLSISSWLIRDAIRLDCDLMVVDDLLGPTVSYCRALYLTLDSKEPPDCAGIIGSLWNLYQAVASESACVKFIKYLESHISDDRTPTVQRDNDMFSLASVYSENDVDETVQQLRLSCLQPFLKCLPFVTSSEETGLIVSRCFVGGLLGALVTDLRTGLDGNSGGIRRELYITYCMSIEECASLLFNHNMLSFDCSIFLLFKEITETLADILTTFPLRDAVLFRTTFILAAAVFPSMCRDMIRRSLCDSNPLVAKVDEMFSIDLVLFDRVLDDCIEILIRWAGLRKPYLIPWLDIAGPDHADLKNNGTNDFYKLDNKSSNVSLDGSQTRDDEIPRFVHVLSPPRRDHQSDSCPTNMRQRIRFYTKEIWSWALSCSLLRFEQKWLESERTIIILNGSVLRAEVEISSTDWKKFFEVRKRELQKSLTNINRFFHTSTGFARRDQRGNQVVLDMMAMNLPSAPRLRLCFLIECVSRVLIHSIKCSCSFLCGEATSTNQELSIFESLCCLSAWLSPNKDNPDGDFSVGIFKMLAIASRIRPQGESTSHKCDTAELLARISQVSEHVRRLYLALKNFQKSLRGLSTDEGRGYQTELIGSFFDDKNTKNEILRLTILKLHSLQKVMPTEFQVKSLPDFPSDNANEVIPQSLDRKRTRRENKKSTLRPREKRVRTKNRNKVVDIFMNMDQDNDSAVLKSTRDAYTDLEDFLVEG